MSSEGTDPYVPGHGDPTYSVLNYELDLTYKVDANNLHGRARLLVRALQGVDHVGLDLHALKVDRVLVDGRRVRWRARRDKVMVSLPETVPAGTEFALTLRYGGTPRQVRSRHLGTAGWEELTDGALVAGQPHGAPSWFPCNDRPDDKSRYRIAVTVPAGYVALANGSLAESTRHGAGTTFTFEQDEPMSPYLCTVHVGRYERVDLDGPVPAWALAPSSLVDRLESAFGRQPEMMKTFIEAFGPYPFDAYGVVVTEDDLEIPLESQGFSTFGANCLHDDWDAVRLVAHELAHQWFGNSLTVKTWNDIWLHEGFACYAEWLWSEASGADTADECARRHHEVLQDTPQDFPLADPGPDLMFDDRVYKRGALTLHAIRLGLGDKAFFDLLRTWTEDHRHGIVTSDELVQRVVARAPAAMDAEALCAAWLQEPALPDLPPPA